ncbi:hypothetical protein [Streptomyces ardesiacus]|uniref:hypothetical protein n=1 Tax=Streptomyces ardesiacus TaxID=285564 RepID=UPI00201F89F1|nr:hypothetical protein [Streptomyces ardesiacus]MCL7368801.1 hypothetical protein [Streptomyces ardesiacus]
MTQSGQGEEPSARQAREGIVLPSDGGEPLLPGRTDVPVGPQAGGPPPSAPPGGQAWDRPWGPEQQHAPAGGQGWPTPPDAQPWGDPQTPQPPATQAWPPVQGDPGQVPGALPPQAGPGPLPPEGAPPPSYGAPVGDQSYGAQQPYGHQHQQYQQHQQHHPDHQQHEQHQQYGGPVAPLPSAPLPSAPLPSADEGATQYLPPVVAAADEGATQYIPHIPPAGPGALPPEAPPAQPHAEPTPYLGQAPQYSAQPAPAAAHPDAEATQFIAPVPGGPAGAPFGTGPGADEGRQPPAEFDNLFRGAPGADGPASATQQMPRFDAPEAPYPGDRPGYAPKGPGGGGGRRRGAGDDGGRGGRGGRTPTRVPLLAAVGVGIAVVGVGAGAMMAGGGEGGDKGANQPVSATAPVSESASASPSPSVDPAEQQAVELDKLLAESGTGRTTVINAVADVKTCDNLSKAAADLREAAKQRNGLVESLGKLSVDKLPRNTELTSALTKAWQASASADNHYAAWADRTAGKKGCKKGKATTQPSAANRESGTASKEKAKAAKLWNAIAKKYGLTERQPTQL